MTYFVRHTVIYIVSLCLVLWGIAEAVYGGLQLYGLSESNHSLYNITGSFRNPGPYAGFLAVVLPVALYLALSCRIRSKCLRQGTVALCWVYVFLCVTLLPATLSRSAWIAAGVGSGIVLCARYRLRTRCILYFRRHRRRAWALACAACLLLALAGAGAYYLKKNSADGRLLMWKETLCAIAEVPYTGTGPVVHPRPETQLIDQDEIPGHDGRLHGIAGDGIEIHHKQPEHCCNQQRNDNDGDVLQQGFDELFHNTGYFSSKIFFLYNSHICELVAGFPMPTTRFVESKRNVLYCGLKEKLFFLSMMPKES